MSGSVNFKVKFSKRYQKVMGAKYLEYGDEALKRTIVEAESICVREAPVKEGTLRRGIGTAHPNMGTVQLTGPKHWVYVQYGTPPHVIKPKRYTLLHWEDKDGEHFAREVHHPGTKANPFVTRTLKKIQSKNLIEQNLYDVLKKEGIIE